MQTTADIYSHLDAEDLRRELDGGGDAGADEGIWCEQRGAAAGRRRAGLAGGACGRDPPGVPASRATSPTRTTAWLYGPHCAVDGCELPIQATVERPRRHLRVQRPSAQLPRPWARRRGGVAGRRPGRCATSAAAARPTGSTIGGQLEVELRYGLQCWHDGQHVVVLGSGRWCGLLAAPRSAPGVSSVLDLDAARDPHAVRQPRGGVVHPPGR